MIKKNEGNLDSHVLLSMTAEIVASFVSRNTVEVEDMPRFVEFVYQSISGIEKSDSQPISDLKEPAVPIEDSIHPDYLICLEDGKKVVVLKRYLRHFYNMTPEQYRARWGLPKDYPMIPKNYSKQRSAIGKKGNLNTYRSNRNPS